MKRGAPRKGITVTPYTTIKTDEGVKDRTSLQTCLEGSKQAALLDLVARPGGATMQECMTELLSGRTTIYSMMGGALRNKGYGFKSVLEKNEAGEVTKETFHLVLPPYATEPAPHRARRCGVKQVETPPEE